MGDSETPPWWSDELSELIRRREPMPDVEGLSSLYVRPWGASHPVLATSWERTSSQYHAQQLANDSTETAMGARQLLAQLQGPNAPHGVTLRMQEAPAEWSVPVKQDRRLSPSFKVRVDVQVGNAPLELPITVRAQLITHAHKEALLNTPTDGSGPVLPLVEDAATRKFTELKGTSVQSATIKADAVSGTAADVVGSNDALTLLPTVPGDERHSDLIPALGNENSAQLRTTAGQDACDLLVTCGSGAKDGLERGVKPDPSAPLPSALSTPRAAKSPRASHPHNSPTRTISHMFDFPNLELLKPTRMNKVYLVFECTVLGADRLLLVYHVPTIGICRAEQRPKAIQKLGVPYEWPAAGSEAPLSAPAGSGPGGGGAGSGGGSASGSVGAAGTDGRMWSAQTRPKRAAAAANTWADEDKDTSGTPPLPDPSTSWGQVVNGQPALQGMLRQDSLTRPGGPDAGLVGQHGYTGLPGGRASSLSSTHPSHLSHPSHPSQTPQGPEPSGLGAVGMTRQGSNAVALPPSAGPGGPARGGHAPGAAAFLLDHGWQPPSLAALGVTAPMHHAQRLTRQAMADYIASEYRAAGFARQLTQQDMQALLVQAGFPAASGPDHSALSEAEWAEFAEQWALSLLLLRQVARVWDCVEPCIIAGFHMDRQGTVHALCREPVGTFVIRFSLSQPGSLVLSCRAYPGTPGVDGDGLLHAMLKLQDLMEQGVEAWVADFPGASHVLDVYRQARVDKHALFPAAPPNAAAPASGGPGGPHGTSGGGGPAGPVSVSHHFPGAAGVPVFHQGTGARPHAAAGL